MPVSLAAVRAVGGGLRVIERRRLVKGQSRPESGLLPLVPGAGGPALLPSLLPALFQALLAALFQALRPAPFQAPFLADLDAGLPFVLLELLGKRLKHHFPDSFPSVDELFRQIDHAASYRQAAQDYGQHGPAIAFGGGRSYRQAQRGNAPRKDQDDAKGQGIDDYFDRYYRITSLAGCKTAGYILMGCSIRCIGYGTFNPFILNRRPHPFILNSVEG